MSIKSFSKSTLIYSFGTIALRFTSFLLIPIFTHYLTQEEFGLLQTLLLTIQIIITINDFGMRSALMRFFNEYRNMNKTNELLGSSFSINIISSIFFLSIAFVVPDRLISKFFNTEYVPNLMVFTVIAGITQTLSLNILSYFRAKEQGLTYMILSLGSSLLLITITYLFIVDLNFGIVGVMWAQSITFFLLWFGVLIYIIKKDGLGFNSKLIVSLVKFGFPLIFAMSGDMVINTLGTYLLGHFHSLNDVAIFSLAFKIATISIMVIVGPFQLAYEPYVFKNKDNPELSKLIGRLTTYSLLGFILISWIILFIFRDLIKIIAPQEYFSAYQYIFFIMPGLGAMLLNYIGQSLLHIKQKTFITGSIILLSVILSSILLYFLTKYFSIDGLIISINFYLIFSSFTLFYFGYKEVKVDLVLNKIILLITVALVLIISCYILSYLNSYIYYLGSILIFSLNLILIYNYMLSVEEKSKIKYSLKKYI